MKIFAKRPLPTMERRLANQLVVLAKRPMAYQVRVEHDAANHGADEPKLRALWAMNALADSVPSLERHVRSQGFHQRRFMRNGLYRTSSTMQDTRNRVNTAKERHGERVCVKSGCRTCK